MMRSNLTLRFALSAFALYSLLLLQLSCSAPLPEPTEGGILLTIGLEVPPGSRATGTSDEAEDAVRDLQVLVFAEGGTLETYGRSSGGEITLKCRLGEKEVWALVNSPDASGLKSLQGMRDFSIPLSSNTASSLAMAGCKAVTVTAGHNSDTISVSRLCAKVVLKGISIDMTSDYLRGESMTLQRIFMTNVPADYLPGGGSDMSGVWYNKMGYRGEWDPLLCDVVGIELNGAYSVQHSFYVYPNSADEDVRGGTWSPRATRMVIEALFQGRTCYYVLDLPDTESNHSYVFSGVTLTRPGSDDPESNPAIVPLEFSFQVAPWSEYHDSYHEYL